MWLALPPLWRDDSLDPQLSALPGTGLPSHKALAKLEEEMPTFLQLLTRLHNSMEFGESKCC